MITTEEIDGKKYTVVWPDDAVSQEEVANARWWVDWNGVKYAVDVLLPNNEHIIATALPALQRKPKPEDARLLYLYMAHGLTMHGKYAGLQIDMYDGTFPHWLNIITHATLNSERVEIALED